MKLNTIDRPKLLGDRIAMQNRLHQIHQPHVKPLTEFVENLRIEMVANAAIPYFDPWDGGVDAELLMLLEAPGPNAVNSGFISRNNPDETAKNIFELFKKSGIERKRTVIWNIVPWYIGTGAKIRAATQKDIKLGMNSLHALIGLLPKINAVLMLGKKAQKAKPYFGTNFPNLKLFSCPHPSPLFVNRLPGNREILLEHLRNVRKYIYKN